MTLPRPKPWTPPNPLPGRYLTPRIEIRWWRPEDAPGMLEGIEVDRASLAPWLPWALVDNRNVAECTFHIERGRREREAGTNFMMGWFDRATGAPIGGSGFHRVEPELATAEIGYWMRADRRRQGLCSEAVAHTLSWGFAPLERGGWGWRRITIYCAGGNGASRRVCEKLGLRQEVHQRRARWVDGVGWDDTLGWGVLAEEWDVDGARIRRA